MLTPTQREIHEAHKARHARFAAAARRVSPDPERMRYALPVPKAPEPEIAEPDPVPEPQPVADRKPFVRLFPLNRDGICREILRFVAGERGVGVRDITSTARFAHLIEPRFLAIYLAREITKLSLPHLGRRFGGRDHTSILHAIRTTQQRIDTYPEYAAHVEALKAKLIQQLGVAG
jgi:hypothetical protein